MPTFTPSQIKFVGDYGYGPFPYQQVLSRLVEAMEANLRPNDIWINSGKSGKPELFVDQGRPGNAFCRVFLRAAVTTTPDAETLAFIKLEDMPALEASIETGEVRVFYPGGYRWSQPFEKRVYVKFGADCYDLVREYLAREFNNVIPAGGKDSFMSHKEVFGESCIQMGLRDLGFETVMKPQPGDVVIMHMGEDYHVAAFTRDGGILHHFGNRFSCIDEYTSMWKDCTVEILRRSAK